jgi:hypothetical protein
MRRIISLVSAALALAACSNPTAPGSADRSVEAAKAKAALGAAARGASAERHTPGRLSAN